MSILVMGMVEVQVIFVEIMVLFCFFFDPGTTDSYL